MTKIAVVASAALLGLWKPIRVWAAGTATNKHEREPKRHRRLHGCRVLDIAFGSVQGSTATAPADVGSTLTVTCTNGTPYTVSFRKPERLSIQPGQARRWSGRGST